MNISQGKDDVRNVSSHAELRKFRFQKPLLFIMMYSHRCVQSRNFSLFVVTVHRKIGGSSELDNLTSDKKHSSFIGHSLIS